MTADVDQAPGRRREPHDEPSTRVRLDVLFSLPEAVSRRRYRPALKSLQALTAALQAMVFCIFPTDQQGGAEPAESRRRDAGLPEHDDPQLEHHGEAARPHGEHSKPVTPVRVSLALLQ